MPEHQNASLWTCSGAWALLPTTRTRRTRPQGRVLRVRDGFPHPRHENANPVSRFRVWDIPAPFPPPSTTQTRRTRPCGRVLRVWNVANTLPAPITPPCTTPDTKNATVGSRHSCLGRKSCREGVGNIPDTKNATTGSRSSCLGGLYILSRKIQIMSFLKKII